MGAVFPQKEKKIRMPRPKRGSPGRGGGGAARPGVGLRVPPVPHRRYVPGARGAAPRGLGSPRTPQGSVCPGCRRGVAGGACGRVWPSGRAALRASGVVIGIRRWKRLPSSSRRSLAERRGARGGAVRSGRCGRRRRRGPGSPCARRPAPGGDPQLLRAALGWIPKSLPPFSRRGDSFLLPPGRGAGV